MSSVDVAVAPEHARVDVLGVGVSAITMADAVATLERWIAEGARKYVCVTTVHGVMESQDDPELRSILNRSGMTTPDGMPLVWLAHRAGQRHVTRVYGPDLLLAFSEVAARKGYRFFLYGGDDGVADELARRLTLRFPGLEIAGCYTPPFRPLGRDEDEQIVDLINNTRPDVVWVGLSTPKQEHWMAQHLARINAAALVGVGAAFDFHSGRKKQAPVWMQRNGLEWFYRLCQEPRRLGRRYVVLNSRFLLALTLASQRSTEHPPDA